MDRYCQRVWIKNYDELYRIINACSSENEILLFFSWTKSKESTSEKSYRVRSIQEVVKVFNLEKEKALRELNK